MDLTAKNQRWINIITPWIDHLRSSPIIGIALSYLPRRLRRSNQDLSLFDLSRSSSFPRACVVNLRLIAGITAFSGFPALFVGFRHVAGISPRRWNFPRFSLAIAASLEFPALSVDLRRVAGIPAL